MQVSEAMTRDVRVAHVEETIEQAAQLMAGLDAGALPVSENERLVGMITDRDIAINLNEIAHILGVTASKLKEELALIGLGELVDAANKLAFSDAFDRGEVDLKKPILPRIEHLVEAARDFNMTINTRSASQGKAD